MIGKLIDSITTDSKNLHDLDFGKNYEVGIYNIVVTKNNESKTFKIIKK